MDISGVLSPEVDPLFLEARMEEFLVPAILVSEDLSPIRGLENGFRSFNQLCPGSSMRSAMSSVCVDMVTGLSIVKGPN